MRLKVLPDSKAVTLSDAPSIRWGIIAPGGIARGFARDIQNFTPMNIHAVGSRSIQRAESFAAEFGIPKAYGSYEELVADTDIDAIYVASPHSEHFAHARLALEAGKPVLVEKSFTKTAAEASELVNLARDKNLLVMEAMWTRFLPHIDVVLQLVRNGAIGEILSVTADHGQLMKFGPEHRVFNKKLAGGALLDLGIYPISFAVMVLGVPDRISAIGALTQTDVDEQVSAIFSYPHAQALINTTLAAKTPTVATINGTDARIEIHGDFYAPIDFDLIYPDGERISYKNTSSSREGGLAYQAAHFAELLVDGRIDSNIMPAAETVAIMKMMDEIRDQIGYVL